MRNAIRRITLVLALLALLVAGPLAAAPGSAPGAAARPLAGQELVSPGAWLQGFWSRLGAILVGSESDAVFAPSRAAAEPGKPASPDPELGVSPQEGADIDPDG